MLEPPPERRWKKNIVRSFRFNRDLLASMEAECRVRHVSLSEYVRQASVAFMRLRSRIALRFGKATTDLPPQGCTRRLAEPSTAASAISAAVTGLSSMCEFGRDQPSLSDENRGHSARTSNTQQQVRHSDTGNLGRLRRQNVI